MEAALHQEKEFSDRLIEKAQAIVLVLDTRGRIVRFNHYTEQLTGFRLEDVEGQDWFATCLPAGERDRELSGWYCLNNGQVLVILRDTGG